MVQSRAIGTRVTGTGVIGRAAGIAMLCLLLLTMPGAPLFAADARLQQVADGNGSEQAPPQPLEDALRETAERVATALRLLLMAIPQYEAPEILDNGDILIRRSRPEPAPAPDDEQMGEAYQQEL